MKLFGSKTSAPDLPSNQLPCPCFPPVPQMDPLSHQVLGFQPTVCFAKSVGCAWAFHYVCVIYRLAAVLDLLERILKALLQYLPAVPPPASVAAPVASKLDETPAPSTDTTEGHA